MATSKAKTTKSPAARKTTTAKKAAPAKKSAAKKSAAKKSAAKKSSSARKAAPARKGAVSKRAAAVAAVDRTADLSQDVLKSIESAQLAALEAVHKFVDTVDEALPALGERPSRRERVIDAALEMADRLVATQYEFLSNTVRNADRTLRDAVPEEK